MSRNPARQLTLAHAFPLPIVALALAAFAIGTTEFVIVGLLPAVASDLHVSLPSAGLLVTGYALGVAFGAPPLAAITARARPHRALTGLLLLFLFGNAVCAVAPNYAVLMTGRVVASLTHGAFFGVGAVVAASLVPPNRRSAAIALMFTGLTLANVLGVPAGAWLGQQAGWRSTFWAVCALGAVALAAVMLLVPRNLAAGAQGAGGPGWRIVQRPRLLAALLLTALGFGGIFTTLTYIAPLLQVASGFSAAQVNGLLLLFGLGMTLGNFVGGWLADRWPGRSMFAILGALAAIEVGLYFALPLQPAVAVGVFLWGLAAFATAPGLQSRVLDEAKEAPALASTLNIGAFNLGNALAAGLGAKALAAQWPLSALPLLSAGLALVALGVLGAAGSQPRADQAGCAARSRT